jgi:hypothetical protein
MGASAEREIQRHSIGAWADAVTDALSRPKPA